LPVLGSIYLHKYVVWTSPKSYFNKTANPHAPNAVTEWWQLLSNSATSQAVYLIEPIFS
jgi:hypothetical protein